MQHRAVKRLEDSEFKHLAYWTLGQDLGLMNPGLEQGNSS